MSSRLGIPTAMALPELLDRLGEAVAVLDAGWRFVLVNEAGRQLAARIFGEPVPALVGQQLWEVFPELIGSPLESAAREAIAQGGVRTIEVRHAGTRRWIEARLAPADGGLVALCREVTERKQTEARLRRSETSLAEAQALAHIGSWQWDVALDRITWSDELYRIFGLAPGSIEITYDNFLSRVHPDNRVAVDDAVARAYRLGTGFTCDHRIVRPDGQIREVRITGTVQLGDDGQPTRMQGTCQDITEQSRVEADARRLVEERARRAEAEAAEDRVTKVLDSIDELFITTDRDWRLTFVNARARGYLDVLGISPDEVTGKIVWDALPAMRDSPFHRAALEAAALEREVEVEAYYPPLERWFATRIVPGADGVVSYSRDVTERRTAEAALTEGVELLRAIIEGTADSIFVKDLQGRYVMVNSAAAARMGGAPSDIVGRSDAEFFPPAAALRLQANDRAVARSGVSRTYEETMPEHGRDRIYLATKGVYRDADGRVAGVIGISRDITERKHAEERQMLLAEAGRVLTSSLDYEVTLARAARMALPVFADFCLVDLLLEDGTVQRVELAHVDPDKEEALRATAIRYEPDPRWEGHPTALALRTGEPVFQPDFDLTAFLEAARDREHREYLRALQPVSVIAVPLTVQGNVLGALTFCLSDSARRYEAGDLAFARELADRAALAVQNARLYRAAQAEIAQRSQVEAALRRWAEIFEHAGWGVVMSDAALTSILTVNPGFARMYGGTTDEFLGHPLADVLAPETAARLPAILRTAEERGRAAFEGTHRRRDGTTFPAAVDLTAVRDERGRVLYYAANVQDLTERHRAEEQLRQAQKMEAVGRLAGGIAHDFNNMLMIIIGFSDFLLGAIDPSERTHADALEIKKAAERATALTRQLLAFGGPQSPAAAVLDINVVVTDMERMLRPLVGEAVGLATTLTHPLAGVETDRGQLEQAIINLALNARDAMPGGGRLMIRTSNVHWGEGEAYEQVGIDIPAGAYVMLVVADTGVGMDAATRARIFEPFFSTKPASRNTGLGLATVYGIVSQSGGYLWVESEPGRGSTFFLCFPAAGAASGEERVRDAPPARGGTETILLVEDEQAVRTLATRALREQGYRVLSAEHGRAALVHLHSNLGVDLLVSDVVMPELGGVDLADRARAARPNLPVLLISGYTENDTLRRRIADSGLPFLQKPFSPESLLRRVRELLDSRAAARPEG